MNLVGVKVLKISSETKLCWEREKVFVCPRFSVIILCAFIFLNYGSWEIFIWTKVSTLNPSSKRTGGNESIV